MILKILKDTLLWPVDKTICQFLHTETSKDGKQKNKQKNHSLAYLVYKYIDWNIQGASSRLIMEITKSHSHVEPLAVASSVQTWIRPLPALAASRGVFPPPLPAPAFRVEQDKKLLLGVLKQFTEGGHCLGVGIGERKWWGY